MRRSKEEAFYLSFEDFISRKEAEALREAARNFYLADVQVRTDKQGNGSPSLTPAQRKRAIRELKKRDYELLKVALAFAHARRG